MHTPARLIPGLPMPAVCVACRWAVCEIAADFCNNHSLRRASADYLSGSRLIAVVSL
jgi:hypothetical protein